MVKAIGCKPIVARRRRFESYFLHKILILKMILKLYTPITPTLRHKISVDRSFLWKGRPIKYLTQYINKTGGRNNLGRITSYHIGGGHKRLYRNIDFNRNIIGIPAIIVRLEYDPNRSSFIALICYKNGILSYIIAPSNVKIGDIIYSDNKIGHHLGNNVEIKDMLVGSVIHNVEIKPGNGSQIARSAGTYCVIVSKNTSGYAMLKLNSGELRMVPLLCKATLGICSNLDHKNESHGKAGYTRWIGRRPTVRGVAMNPIDHPHGGGEGKTSGGRCSVTPWGKLTKGKKTVTANKNKLIVKRIN